jgi:hypothetical protein
MWHVVAAKLVKDNFASKLTCGCSLLWKLQPIFCKFSLCLQFTVCMIRGNRNMWSFYVAQIILTIGKVTSVESGLGDLIHNIRTSGVLS